MAGCQLLPLGRGWAGSHEEEVLRGPSEIHIPEHYFPVSNLTSLGKISEIMIEKAILEHINAFSVRVKAWGRDGGGNGSSTV